MRIIVATHNEGKLAEINRILEDCLGADAARVELVSAGSLNLPDPVEDGVTFQENALIKARDVAARTGCPAIADDSGLIVDVMGNAPGILSARWAGRHGDDKANNALLLAQMADIPDAKRTARFRCAAALVMPETEAGAGANGRYAIGSETVKTGEMPGVLLHEPHGEHGFGYDPLFVPDDQPARAIEAGEKLTSAQMEPAEKNAISHRGKALRALLSSVATLLKKEKQDRRGVEQAAATRTSRRKTRRNNCYQVRNRSLRFRTFCLLIFTGRHRTSPFWPSPTGRRRTAPIFTNRRQSSPIVGSKILAIVIRPIRVRPAGFDTALNIAIQVQFAQHMHIRFFQRGPLLQNRLMPRFQQFQHVRDMCALVFFVCEEAPELIDAHARMLETGDRLEPPNMRVGVHAPPSIVAFHIAQQPLILVIAQG